MKMMIQVKGAKGPVSGCVLVSCVPHLEIIICEHDDPQRLTYDTKDTPKHCISDERIVKSFVNPLGYVG